MITDPEFIKMWLRDHEVRGFTIRPDMTVDVDGEVNLASHDLTCLPFQFGEVKGPFTVRDNELISLEGCPVKCWSSFDCSKNQLTSLDHGPRLVSGDYNCSYNRLTTLRGAPPRVLSFDCSMNRLADLEHGPSECALSYNCKSNTLGTLFGSPDAVVGVFDCSNNQLKSLRHGPSSTRAGFDCSYNQLSTLTHGPRVAGKYNCQSNQLADLQGAPTRVESFDCSLNKPLTCLIGGPQQVVLGDYNAKDCALVSLDGAPAHVNWNLIVSGNQLTSPAFSGDKGHTILGDLVAGNNPIRCLDQADNVFIRGQTFTPPAQEINHNRAVYENEMLRSVATASTIAPPAQKQTRLM